MGIASGFDRHYYHANQSGMGLALRHFNQSAESFSESGEELQDPMKPKLINDPYRNPFHNRFHVPVHSRLDEMQAYTQMVWLNDESDKQTGTGEHARHWGRAIAGAFALILLVVFSAALLSRTY